MIKKNYSYLLSLSALEKSTRAVTLSIINLIPFELILIKTKLFSFSKISLNYFKKDLFAELIEFAEIEKQLFMGFFFRYLNINSAEIKFQNTILQIVNSVMRFVLNKFKTRRKENFNLLNLDKIKKSTSSVETDFDAADQVYKIRFSDSITSYFGKFLAKEEKDVLVVNAFRIGFKA